MPEVALILFPFQILAWSGETVIEKGIARKLLRVLLLVMEGYPRSTNV